jgi:hypothetical protein
MKHHQYYDGLMDAKHLTMVSIRVMRKQGELVAVVVFCEQGSLQLPSLAVSVSPKSHPVS